MSLLKTPSGNGLLKNSGSTYKLGLHEQALERLLAAESEEKS